MNKYSQVITNYLVSEDNYLCDDCLSELLNIKPRQTINAVCNKLFKQDIINRYKGECSCCKKNKMVNGIGPIRNNEKIEKISYVVSNKDYHHNHQDINNNGFFLRLSPKDFENRVGLYLNKKFKDSFSEKPLIIGVNKVHKFDLVSSDNSIVAECKSYTWTKYGNFPSAKISTAIEAVFYLSRIIAERKILVFQDDFNKKGESLVEIFIKRYDGILDDVEIWRYLVGETIDYDSIEIIREGKESWYKNLYK
ncbi:hypothetical protein [Tepidanaerobacter syntrophicus]|uniref:hypothetical protein n=1 Tax=Tepidanaerobacter syntrophicus TaxID=224999 RepID=UPI0004B61A54|nr:hypothetical protein [Tepidanaerobacter syntrophicus]